MSRSYYSDRELGPRPPTEEELTEAAWGGLISIVNRGIAEALFGESFPLLCEDGRGPYACDEDAFRLALLGDIPEMRWPLVPGFMPATLAAMDLAEFLHEHASAPTERDWHPYFGHAHLNFDQARGQQELRDRVNRLFSRNGLAYELSSDGAVKRLLSPVVDELVRNQLPATGDSKLDDLLERAVRKFMSPDAEMRREALEQLWDAFERSKTILDRDKKRGAAALIAEVSTSDDETQMLTMEFRELSRIGNNFLIRHHETTKAEVGPEAVDYYFTRMFALIHRLHPAIVEATGANGELGAH